MEAKTEVLGTYEPVKKSINPNRGGKTEAVRLSLKFVDFIRDIARSEELTIAEAADDLLNGYLIMDMDEVKVLKERIAALEEQFKASIDEYEQKILDLKRENVDLRIENEKLQTGVKPEQKQTITEAPKPAKKVKPVKVSKVTKKPIKTPSVKSEDMTEEERKLREEIIPLLEEKLSKTRKTQTEYLKSQKIPYSPARLRNPVHIPVETLERILKIVKR
jgi:regulator of replication initiation timing